VTSLTVNGQQVDIDRPDDTALLTVLRDALSLVGSRFGYRRPPSSTNPAAHAFTTSDSKPYRAHVSIARSCGKA
jgi:aerobic-type carbon monoxide dehydrogenase small subunit (CoxS/CutS family)